MNVTRLEKKLLSAARNTPPSERVPYAFEKRVMAHLAAKRPVLDLEALWARLLWRAVTPCLAVMLLLAAWSLYAPKPTAPVGDLSQDIENTLLAAVDQDQPLELSW